MFFLDILKYNSITHACAVYVCVCVRALVLCCAMAFVRRPKDNSQGLVLSCVFWGFISGHQPSSVVPSLHEPSNQPPFRHSNLFSSTWGFLILIQNI